jgi:hypothetical protein
MPIKLVHANQKVFIRGCMLCSFERMRKIICKEEEKLAIRLWLDVFIVDVGRLAN